MRTWPVTDSCMSDLNICANTGDALASTSLWAGKRRSSTTSMMSLKVALPNQLSSPAAEVVQLRGSADSNKCFGVRYWWHRVVRMPHGARVTDTHSGVSFMSMAVKQQQRSVHTMCCGASSCEARNDACNYERVGLLILTRNHAVGMRSSLRSNGLKDPDKLEPVMLEYESCNARL